MEDRSGAGQFKHDGWTCRNEIGKFEFDEPFSIAALPFRCILALRERIIC
jgi:hypothetical protein